MRRTFIPANILFRKLTGHFTNTSLLSQIQRIEIGLIDDISLLRRPALDGQHDVHGLLAFNIRRETDGRTIEAVAKFAAVNANCHLVRA